MSLLLEINKLSFAYSSANSPVLDNMSLKLQAGEFAILVGANGSGKSTFFKILTKQIKPSKGGFQVYTQTQKPHICYIAQNPDHGLFPDLTLRENLSLFRISLGTDTQIASYLDDFNKKLKKYLDTPVKHLSGGEKQAFLLSMMLFHTPDLLLLDEHTSALDPKAEKELMELTQHIVKERQITTIMCTHKPEHALTVGSRIIGLKHGKVLVDKSQDSVASISELLKEVYAP